MGENPCTLLVPFNKGCLYMVAEVLVDLQGSDFAAKISAMKRAILLILNGVTLPQLFFTVVRHVLPDKHPILQKLLLLYLEIVDKRDTASGEVRPEMILLLQYFRNNLQHPNEYIRGVTLRFLCRLREPELLHPLVLSILANLKHEHSFVRRHALSALSVICHLPLAHMLLPYARIGKLALSAVAFEQDAVVQRNAFLLLCDCAQDLAVKHLLANAPHVAKWPDLLQMVALDLIRKVCCSSDHPNKDVCIKIIFSILSNCRNTVKYKCAGTLLSLPSTPVSVRVAANTYCKLLTSESDTNVKLIILDRLHELYTSHRYVMVDFVMDVLCSLTNPNVDVFRKVLNLVLGLLTGRNVQEVVLYLKKVVVETQGSELQNVGEYHQMLVQAIHACAVEYPQVAGSVVHLLVDFVVESKGALAFDVILFVREIIETNPVLRVSIVQRLFDAFSHIQEPFVCTCALWIFGEYSLSVSEVESAISTIKQSLGNLPFCSVSEEGESTDSSKPAHPLRNSCTVRSTRPIFLANSTHPTEIVATDAAISATDASTQYLRSLIVLGDFHLAAVVAYTLTKLVLRLEEVHPSKVEINKASTESLLIMVALLQLGHSSCLPHPIDRDSYDRIVLCVKLLCNTSGDARKVLLLSCRQSFVKMLDEKMKANAQISHTQPDDLIEFYHLKKKGLNQLKLGDEYRDDLKAPTVEFTKHADDANRLNRLVQLTGFSDPVYAEACVTVNKYYNAVLDVTVINRTKVTLQNMCLEFQTAGEDRVIIDRSQNYTLAPRAIKQIQATFKISSANDGVIIPHIFYEASNGIEQSEVLNNIFINILDYMSSVTCTDTAFRSIWAECRYEIKLEVNTVLQDEMEFLNHIIKSTNMACLTPPSALYGDCGLIVANLYAKSVFGEDALMNISVEKQADGKLSGYIRIRSNIQGMVLNLGDIISVRQMAAASAAMTT